MTFPPLSRSPSKRATSVPRLRQERPFRRQIRGVWCARIRVAGRDARPGFLSLLPPSEARFASLLPSLSVGLGVILKLLIQKGYRLGPGDFGDGFDFSP